MLRKRIEVTGYVQGVGFRPFVYRLAKSYELSGFIKNQNGKVIIEVQGDADSLQSFIKDLSEKKPAISKIHSLIEFNIPLLSNEVDFRIVESEVIQDQFSEILPDIAICDDCKRELLDKNDHRYYYPFINCTNCGPRYSIIHGHPYDRINTTMNQFRMCKHCYQEYNEPINRRFHAEPIACHECGPIYISVSIDEYNEHSNNVLDYIHHKFNSVYSQHKTRWNRIVYNQNLISEMLDSIKKGSIIAIKGIGGYHIACDPFNDEAVIKLRQRKNRKYKPFAIMFPDIQTLKEYAYVSPKEKEFLLSKEAPIVLVRAKKNFSDYVIPQPQNFIGAFLPYSPIHYLLMNNYKKPLIMTSANITDEPIFYREDENFKKIFSLVDCVYIHNREIFVRNDDSVVKFYKNHPIFFRISRGYSPKTFFYNKNHVRILALGAQLKNTISILHKNKILHSHYIGDLDNIEAFLSFEETYDLYKKIFYFEPDYIAVDFHPEYENTKWALKRFPKNKIIYVQHHHAHIAACMFENQIEESVIGIVLDGTGYGITKNHPSVLGGEIYLANYRKFIHLGSLLPIPLIGGEKAIKETYRIAIGLLYEFYKYFYKNNHFDKFILNFEYFRNVNTKNYTMLLEKQINVIYSSSCGRFFDAISSLLNICHYSDYEAHAAISLEQVAYSYSIKNPSYNAYSYRLIKKNRILYLDWRYIVKGILEDLSSNTDIGLIALKVHNTIAKAYSQMVIYFAKKYKIRKIVLSGGCFQNLLLLEFFYKFLYNHVDVYFHKELSPGDSSVSIGQLLIANALLNQKPQGVKYVFSNSYENIADPLRK